jgi:hypothetical protein
MMVKIGERSGRRKQLEVQTEKREQEKRESPADEFFKYPFHTLVAVDDRTSPLRSWGPKL